MKVTQSRVRDCTVDLVELVEQAHQISEFRVSYRRFHSFSVIFDCFWNVILLFLGSATFVQAGRITFEEMSR